MKIKQCPEDFQVEELTEVVPQAQGPFALYRLEKRDWTTPDALEIIRRRWKLDWRRLSWAGMKDRYAHTVQYFTIFRGPQRGLAQQEVKVKYLGQSATPYTSRELRANRFRITLRALSRAELHGVEPALGEVRTDGVPNYFDDQRFGSVGETQEFAARFMILGEYERALQLALTAPYACDRAPQKREKSILNSYWEDWKKCRELLPRGASRSLVSYLANHPCDFRGALARLRPELHGLYLSAYQSHLWNRMLARWLQTHCRPEQLVPIRLRLGEVPMHQRLDEVQQAALADLSLPLPSARLRLDPADPRLALMEAVIAEEGFKLSEMKIRGLRKPFFSKGERAALCLPSQLEYTVQVDERHPGRQKLVLSFELPPGSYATLIVKRVQAEAATRPGH
jgi:tRNA pseudouridine13 synthase